MRSAFNSQQIRKKIFLELIKVIHFDAIVETGTYRGNTTSYMHLVTKPVPTHTVELDVKQYVITRWLLRSLKHLKNIDFQYGDSRQFLRRIAVEHTYTLPFFYLDAHWGKDLPLYEEVKFIVEQWPRCVIMIDDCRVPDDTGYFFDAYNDVDVIQLEYFMPLYPDKFAAYFPKARSEEENGAKRGCVVLIPNNPAAEDLRQTVDQMQTLRRYTEEQFIRTCSRRKCIHIIGDSHALYCFEGLDTAIIHPIGPCLMHRVGRDGLQCVDVRNWNVCDGDTVVFVFGEIDVRCHIGRISEEKNVAVETIIQELAEKYCETIEQNRAFFKNLRCVVVAVVPPSENRNNPDYPFFGKLHDRIAITTALNEALRKECAKRQILFLDCNEQYATPEGKLNPAKSDGHVHIHKQHNIVYREQLLALAQND